MTAQAIDVAKSEAFGEHLLDLINGGGVVLMISVGHRTGLFDAMAGLAPSSSADIAKAANLDERYVREWLGAMVTGEIVEFDPKAGSYQLPPEHAALLTRASRPGNMAVTTQWIPLLGSVEDEIVSCFEQGGGVPYASFHRFHEVMAEESDQTVVAVLIEAILPCVPGIIERLEAGIEVADIGCGAGRAITRMARTYPKSQFIGFDISQEAVDIANASATETGVDNLRFEVRDLPALELTGAFDLITAFDVIHDQARPDAVLRAVHRALRDDGTFLMQDIAGSSHVDQDRKHPIGAFLYTVSCMHCMTVSLSSGGAGLGAMWGRETAIRMLAEAGFGRVDVRSLEHDVINDYYLVNK
jgi:2-polyprenyl-3-methyl-5-hydroxy-6-metoxy-1,4-benzoquinol methylase